MGTGKRVLVVGLDSASYRITNKLMRSGLLPFMAKLKERGCMGILRSTCPPVSPVAWPSIVTGLHPGQHGVFGFVYKNSTGATVPYSSMHIRGLTVWDILGKLGHGVAVLNVPMTYPAYEVNGIMVSGPPTPKSRPDVYMSESSEKIWSLLECYNTDIPGVDLTEYSGLDKATFYENAISVTKKKFNLCKEVVKDSSFELIFFVITELDRIHHAFGASLYDLSYPGSHEDKRLALSYYSFLESQLSELLAILDDDTSVFIISDHGFEPLRGYIGINNILYENGFIASDIGFLLKYRCLQVAVRLMGNVAQNILDVIRKLGIGTNYQSFFGTSPKSLAFSYSPAQINIRTKDEHKRKEVFERCKVILENYRVNGKRVIDAVYSGIELYAANGNHEVPDIFVVPKIGYEPRVWSFPSVRRHYIRSMRTTVKNCTHYSNFASDGVFFAFGKAIKKGVVLDCSVLDIVPTIYHMFGVPIPSDLYGRALLEIFEPSSQYAIGRPKGPPILVNTQQRSTGLSQVDEQQILERLSRLGYI